MSLAVCGALGVLAHPAVLRAEEEAAGGNPLFSPSAGLAVWTWVIFLLLVFVLAKTAWKPLLRVLEERERRIQEALDEAQRERDEAAKLLEQYRQLQAEARREAQEVLAEARRAAERIRDELLAEGRREQEEMLERAKRDVQREWERAMESLRREAVDLALAAASRLLRQKLDGAESRRLVEEVLAQLAAPGGARTADREAAEGAARTERRS